MLFVIHNVIALPTEQNGEEEEKQPVKEEGEDNAVKREYDNYRLPLSITPDNYKLEIFTHLNDSEGFAFNGIVEITVSARPKHVSIVSHFVIYA